MSEVMTSPSGGGEGGAVATSGVSDSGSSVSAESVGGGESPELSGQGTATPESAEAIGDSTPATVEETASPSAEFNVDSWDGNIDSLPEEWREAVRHIQKNLEGGYTKKFQSLSEDRKSFESEREAWTSEKDAWEKSKEDIVGERDLLKRILEGEDDPRIQEFTEANEKLKTELESLKTEYSDYKSLVDADIEHQAKEYATQFREQNKEIFDSEEKREQLSKFLTAGWEPEIAVKLIGQEEKVINLAVSLAEGGTPQQVAVEHALMKEGSSPRTPRPGARITSGAENRNNPASTQSSGIPANNRDARMSAARAAVNWAKGQKLS